MSQIHHPNVVLLMGACTEEHNMCIVTELLDGNLHDILHSPDIRLSNLQKLNFAIDIACGMAWLHNAKPHQIIHRDLKPSNLLINENWKVKVADFGLSCILFNSFVQDKTVAIGSARWMAPEVLMGRKLNDRLDVYSFALILWEIFTRSVPYSEYKTVPDFRDAVCKQGVRPSLQKKTIPPVVVDIIQRCWAGQPMDRPSFVEVLESLKDAIADIELTPACPASATLWKRHFPGKTQVSYKLLSNALLGQFNTKIIDKKLHMKCFEALVAHQKKQGSDATSMVNIHQFGLIMSWFGPLEGRPYEPPGTTFLDRLFQVVIRSWFFGDIERAEAEQLLRAEAKKRGMFLVRCNLGGNVTPFVSPFTISCVAKNQRIVHHRVYVKEDKESSTYYIQVTVKGVAQTWSARGGLPDLVNHLKSEGILNKKGLTCVRFKSLFTTTNENIAQYDEESSDSMD
eukprot:TRINITY_DN442_c0_g1_i2.p1 TRINITY_DN442_c0_g1~~TRINITY_DN442_c0_g1_i2.p1  ORF type:complete len:455 (+),score=52.36 TRINITY_DN442_c0_g1_i2:909-2273(+)